jgi:hypothetical protein
MKKLSFLLLVLPLAACIKSQILYNPKLFDRYVGYYQNPERPDEVFTIKRVGDMFFAELPTQPVVSIIPDSQTRFYATVVDAQLSFDTDPQGNAKDWCCTSMVEKSNSRKLMMRWKKIVRQVDFVDSGVRRCWSMTNPPGSFLCAIAGEPD